MGGPPQNESPWVITAEELGSFDRIFQHFDKNMSNSVTDQEMKKLLRRPSFPERCAPRFGSSSTRRVKTRSRSRSFSWPCSSWRRPNTVCQYLTRSHRSLSNPSSWECNSTIRIEWEDWSFKRCHNSQETWRCRNRSSWAHSLLKHQSPKSSLRWTTS